jgi:hypothetical protein
MSDIVIKDAPKIYLKYLAAGDAVGNYNNEIDSQEEAKAAAEEFALSNSPAQLNLFLDYLSKSGFALQTLKISPTPAKYYDKGKIEDDIEDGVEKALDKNAEVAAAGIKDLANIARLNIPLIEKGNIVSLLLKSKVPSDPKLDLASNAIFELLKAETPEDFQNYSMDILLYACKNWKESLANRASSIIKDFYAYGQPRSKDIRARVIATLVTSLQSADEKLRFRAGTALESLIYGDDMSKGQKEQTAKFAIAALQSNDVHARALASQLLYTLTYSGVTNNYKEAMIAPLVKALEDENKQLTCSFNKSSVVMALEELAKSDISEAAKKTLYDLLAKTASDQTSNGRDAAVLIMFKMASPRELLAILNNIVTWAKPCSCMAATVAVLEKVPVEDLLQNYRTLVPALIKALKMKTQRTNGWNHYWDETYDVPVYSAAEIIGKIAKEARRTNNAAVGSLIKQTAVPEMAALLNYDNLLHADYGYVYVLYPLKKALLQALVDSGDPAAIPAIEKCKDLDYTSRYQEAPHNYYSVRDEKQAAIKYLRDQARSIVYIEPPDTRRMETKQ